MTMDIHLQITLPDDCLTPNVPRIKASFFNRKYGELQITPTTPKVSHARIKVISSGRGRPKRSATGSAGSSRSKMSSPFSTRPIKGRSSMNESFDQDFSTPRATKYLLTPPNTRFTKNSTNGRVTHLVYRPLELDNESSSESMDTRRKRKRLEELSSSESRSPLAIEAPRPTTEDDSLTQIIEPQQDLISDDPILVQSISCGGNKSLEVENGSETKDKTEIKVGSKSNEEVVFRDRIETAKAEAMVEQLPDNVKSERIAKKVMLEEPEIIEVEPDLPDSPSFVPGNCNIEDILKLFGKSSQQN